MQRAFRATDRGKQVLDEEDARVGTITGVAERTAHVRPDIDSVDRIDARAVTWTDDCGSFLIDADSVDRIDARAARLKSDSK